MANDGQLVADASQPREQQLRAWLHERLGVAGVFEALLEQA
jgi:hypothetical protein